MKLDVNALRYLDRDEFRVLTAVEMGMRNHELVPVELVTQIASLRLGGAKKMLSTLLRHKLLHHDRQHFDGYRLTSLGYDFLALRTLVARGLIIGVGRQIGVGKESDIFVVVNEDEEELCLKLHRLGRTSFRAIKNKRDYHKHRGSPSWLYLSRLAATKELTFMKVLHENGFPVPTPVDGNRHVILMNLVDGFPLNQVRVLENPAPIYTEMMNLIERFAQHGLIHGDFNEFNVLVNEAGKLTVIDFPQMVSINHPNARMYFERDVNCVRRFFRKKFNFVSDYRPDFEDVLANRVADLDVQVSASGFTRQMAKEFDRFVETIKTESDGEDDEDDEEEEDEDNEDNEEDEDEESQADDQQEATEDESGGDQPKEIAAEHNTAKTNAPSSTPASADSSEVVSKIAGQTEQGESNDDSSEEEDADHDDATVNDDTETVGDGPNAHWNYEKPSRAAERPRVDDIRRRVRRDLRKKGKRSQGTGKTSRNTVKSREKRAVVQSMKEY